MRTHVRMYNVTQWPLQSNAIDMDDSKKIGTKPGDKLPRKVDVISRT